ncbi:hypothetical protein U1Q18_000936 [Sarracenia purpurea var. burkii]
MFLLISCLLCAVSINGLCFGDPASVFCFHLDPILLSAFLPSRLLRETLSVTSISLSVRGKRAFNFIIYGSSTGTSELHMRSTRERESGHDGGGRRLDDDLSARIHATGRHHPVSSGWCYGWPFGVIDLMVSLALRHLRVRRISVGNLGGRVYLVDGSSLEITRRNAGASKDKEKY